MLLGFDALGRWPLGALPDDDAVSTSMLADAGAFATTGNAATFRIIQAAAVGAFTLTGTTAAFQLREVVSAGSYALSGQPATFTIDLAAAPGSFLLGGVVGNETITWTVEGGSFSLSAPDAELRRTGFDYDFQQGGIGHYLLAIEEAKRLARITRKTPAPIDRRTMPRFEPLRGPPIASAAPVADMAAVQNQRMAEAAAVAAAAKRRRDIEAVLLLAS